MDAVADELLRDGLEAPLLEADAELEVVDVPPGPPRPDAWLRPDDLAPEGVVADVHPRPAGGGHGEADVLGRRLDPPRLVAEEAARRAAVDDDRTLHLGLILNDLEGGEAVPHGVEEVGVGVLVAGGVLALIVAALDAAGSGEQPGRLRLPAVYRVPTLPGARDEELPWAGAERLPVVDQPLGDVVREVEVRTPDEGAGALLRRGNGELRDEGGPRRLEGLPADNGDVTGQAVRPLVARAGGVRPEGDELLPRGEELDEAALHLEGPLREVALQNEGEELLAVVRAPARREKLLDKPLEGGGDLRGERGVLDVDVEGADAPRLDADAVVGLLAPDRDLLRRRPPLSPPREADDAALPVDRGDLPNRLELRVRGDGSPRPRDHGQEVLPQAQDELKLRPLLGARAPVLCRAQCPLSSMLRRAVRSCARMSLRPATLIEVSSPDCRSL